MVRGVVAALAPGMVCVALSWLPVRARADRALAATPLGKTALRVDGDLGDFRGVRFATLGDDESGSLEYALGYDDQALYVGARVHDDDFVRSARPGAREDAVVLAFGIPRAGGEVAGTEVWLFAGVPGKQAGSAGACSSGGQPTRRGDVSVVEGPLAGGDGYVLEARVPWSAIEGGRDAAIGRAAIRLVDVDGKPGAKPNVVSSSSASRPAALPYLLLGDGPNAAVQSFYAAKQLAPGSVRFDLAGQVTGDARLDRVVVAGTFVIVAGPGLEAQASYHYVDLPVPISAGVLAAELRELTGDDAQELVLRMEQQNELGKRELLQVIALGPGQPRPLLSIELRKQTDAGSVEAELRFVRGDPPTIDTRIGSANGLDASTYAEQPPQGIQPILLPWGKVARRCYRWDGSAFAIVREEPNEQARAAVPASARTTPPVDEPARVVHAEPPGMDELVAAFREQRGLDPALRPRFVQHANVAEDARIESLLLFGKDLLVIGKGYREGTGYFFYGLPVREAGDIQRMFTADVTGDGRRELFVRHKQLIGDVQREILLVYTFGDGGMDPIAQVEVRRAQGENSVGNVVDIVPNGRYWALRISPGVARGWSASSYPFVAESSDGQAPLLLPWNDRARVYRFEQGRLVPRPRP